MNDQATYPNLILVAKQAAIRAGLDQSITRTNDGLISIEVEGGWLGLYSASYVGLSVLGQPKYSASFRKQKSKEIKSEEVDAITEALLQIRVHTTCDTVDRWLEAIEVQKQYFASAKEAWGKVRQVLEANPSLKVGERVGQIGGEVTDSYHPGMTFTLWNASYSELALFRWHLGVYDEFDDRGFNQYSRQGDDLHKLLSDYANEGLAGAHIARLVAQAGQLQ